LQSRIITADEQSSADPAQAIETASAPLHDSRSVSSFDSATAIELDDFNMPSDLRPNIHRHNDGKSQQPLLGNQSDDTSPISPTLSRRRTFTERDPEILARHATRRRYTYAAFFLFLSLISFAVQTETAVYIQSRLKWNKAYCML
jgi:hypothetical protein